MNKSATNNLNVFGLGQNSAGSIPPDIPIVALAGNPNTGKSTVFNALTGLKQHTGNWPGKTVLQAWGIFTHKNQKFLLVDLPGTYSLIANSEEERIARDFICFVNPAVTIIITDATCLERNLNLTLQVLEITAQAIVCVNLIDEAKRKGIKIDIKALNQSLGVPVLATTARDGKGLDELKDSILAMVHNNISLSPHQVSYPDLIEKKICKWQKCLQEILPTNINPRWAALKILEGDQDLLQKLKKISE